VISHDVSTSHGPQRMLLKNNQNHTDVMRFVQGGMTMFAPPPLPTTLQNAPLMCTCLCSE